MKHLMICLLGLAALLPACKDPEEGHPAPSEVAGPGSAEVRGAGPPAGEAGTGEEPPPAGESESAASAAAPAPPSGGNPAAPVTPLEAKRAEPVRAWAGRPGYAVNPHTGGAIDMRGLPAGTVVRDPKDPNPAHVFRVSREIAAGYEQMADTREKRSRLLRKPPSLQLGKPPSNKDD